MEIPRFINLEYDVEASRAFVTVLDRELYCEVEEKGRWLWWKAGRRNEGRVVEGLGTAIGRMRALESIVLVWSTMRQGWIFCEVVMIF